MEEDTVQAIESRVFKVLLSDDTLVAVGNPAVFPDELKKLSKRTNKNAFHEKIILLRSMTTCKHCVDSRPKDTLEYIRDIPVPGYPYTIWDSVIESFELIK